jgi:hypothetical protein
LRANPISKSARAAKLCGVTLASCLSLVTTTANADEGRPDSRFELGAYGAYLFGGTAESYSGPLTNTASIESAPSYGGTLDVRVRPDALAEVSYTRHPTTLSLRQSDGSFSSYDLTVQYLQVGGLLEFQAGRIDWIRPVFGGTLGATIFSADDAGHSYEEWRFSFILEGGVKFRLHEHFGLRARGRMLATFLTDGSAMFCGGGGCAFVYSGTAVLQGEVGGGAYLSF